jgi:hypothetical protein
MRAEREDNQIFGKHAAHKIRKLPIDYVKNTVQHFINNRHSHQLTL